MRFIDLDASKWATVIMFYDDLLSALEAPDWHGYNANALIDSMVWGDINALEPPYTIRIHNLQVADPETREEVEALAGYVSESKKEHLNLHGHMPEVFFKIAGQ